MELCLEAAARGRLRFLICRLGPANSDRSLFLHRLSALPLSQSQTSTKCNCLLHSSKSAIEMLLFRLKVSSLHMAAIFLPRLLS